LGGALGIQDAVNEYNSNTNEWDKVSTETSTSYLAAGQLLIRYNWIWDSGFTLGLGGGILFGHAGNTSEDSGITGVLPAVNCNLGYAF